MSSGTVASWEPTRPALCADCTLRRTVIDPAIAARHGRIFKTTGDGLFAEFASAVEAVAGAVDIQRGIAAAATEPAVMLRIGINLGDIIVEARDIFGDGVNIAARLETLSMPGGVCISATVHEQVREKLGLAFEDGGEVELKNIAQSVRVFSLAPAAIAAAAALPRTLGAPKAGSWRWALPIAVLLICLVAGAGIWVRVAPGPAPTAQPGVSRHAAIAVLPLAAQGGDGAHDYFEDGLTEDIIAALGRFRDLTVISSAGVASYKGKTLPPAQLGRELNVRYVVEGSVRRTPDRVRISIGLTDTATGALLWSDVYVETPDQIFAVQDQITSRIAGALDLRVGDVELARAAAEPPAALAAYDLVLRGRDLLHRETRAPNAEARTLFEQAIALDPGYAPAYTGLARVDIHAAVLGWTPYARESLERAEALSRKAIELDAYDPAGHATLGSIMVYFGEYDSAIEELNRAIALNGSDADSYSMLLQVRLWRGELAAAIAAGGTLMQLTLSPPAVDAFHLGLAYVLAGRGHDALDVMSPAYQLNLTHPYLNAAMALAYVQTGQPEQAARHAAVVRQADPGFSSAAFGSLLRNQALREKLVALLHGAGL